MEFLGTLYIIAAASGTGKTSLTNALANELKNLTISVSHTTRPVRPNEQHGKDYFFVNTETFETMIKNDGFLEHANVFGHYYYGTSRKFVEDHLKQNLDILLDIDWQGAQQIKSKIPGCVTIFLLPPSQNILRQRLEKRNREPVSVIEHRLKMADSEIIHCKEFDYIVINDDFNKALNDLKTIIEAHRLQTKYQTIKYAKLLEELTKNV